MIQIPKGSVVQVVNFLLNAAIQQGASDIHLEPLAQQMRVRFRVDGVLYEVASLSATQKEEYVSRIKIMSGLDITEKRRPQDGRIAFVEGSNKMDVRVSTLPVTHGEKVVLRLLEQSAQAQLSLEKLGMSQVVQHQLKKLLLRPFGMLLITGPTGSGKSTTLYAALQQVDATAQNILTIEDPVEYQLEGVNQVQVRPEIGFGFSEALRSFLRQDPDVMMVGEIRDIETAEMAIRASLTGHLLLSTLHTNDAPSAITRLIDMGVAPFLVAASLRMVIAQRLVRTICTSCKTPYSPTEEERLLIPELTNMKTYYGKGCEACNGRGYKGRVGVFEVLEINATLEQLISQNASLDVIRGVALENGYIPLRQMALTYMDEGITTVEEVMRKLWGE